MKYEADYIREGTPIPRYTVHMERERETDFRRDLYRAIFAGNVEEAENIANLMAMVGIDRDLIWEARK